MAEGFLHGVEVIEIDNGPRPIRTVRSGVIGLIHWRIRLIRRCSFLVPAGKRQNWGRKALCPAPSTAFLIRLAPWWLSYVWMRGVETVMNG